MDPISVNDAAQFASDRMRKIALCSTPRLLLDLYCLRPGQAQRVHSHGEADKIYYVLQGRATVQVGAEERELSAGTAVLAPAGAPHGVANRSDEPLTLMVCMAPPPPHAPTGGGVAAGRTPGV
jgi:quercetin dioxygenase-like cupin family protein